jgi:hypothetical protein
VDISPSGTLIKAGRTIPTGSVVLVSTELPERMKPIVSEGSVVRIVGGNQMGIHFERLTPEVAERLQEFLLPLITNT